MLKNFDFGNDSVYTEYKPNPFLEKRNKIKSYMYSRGAYGLYHLKGVK